MTKRRLSIKNIKQKSFDSAESTIFENPGTMSD